ncbi:hypothetical protein [Bacillus sp. BHET2]|nr:hypothetical protein [Bacillus sp. BHET2]
MNDSRGGTSMMGTSEAVLYFFIPLLIIAIIIGITIRYFKNKADRNRDF